MLNYKCGFLKNTKGESVCFHLLEGQSAGERERERDHLPCAFLFPCAHNHQGWVGRSPGGQTPHGSPAWVTGPKHSNCHLSSSQDALVGSCSVARTRHSRKESKCSKLRLTLLSHDCQPSSWWLLRSSGPWHKPASDLPSTLRSSRCNPGSLPDGHRPCSFFQKPIFGTWKTNWPRTSSS